MASVTVTGFNLPRSKRKGDDYLGEHEPIQRCPRCNAVLFVAIPNKTTQRDIVAFAQQSALPQRLKEGIIQTRWIHPGVHCPNGCYREYWEYGHQYLPLMTSAEDIAIALGFSAKFYAEFLEKHGAASRIVACVFCKNFRGALLEGQPADAHYRNPKYKPLKNHRVVAASCSDLRVQAQSSEWWYEQGTNQPECPHFIPDIPVYVYRNMGWGEFPE